MTSEPVPIVCTLTEHDAPDQAQDWHDLVAHATHVEAVAGGAHMRFPSELGAAIADLAAREISCCAFLDITTVEIDGDVVLAVTSTQADALPVISLLVGIPLS